MFRFVVERLAEPRHYPGRVDDRKGQAVEAFEACCFFEDGSCEPLTAEVCSLDGGTPRGSRTNCGNVVCAQRTIACCFSNGTCAEQERVDCVAGGGNPQAEGSDCGTTTCRSGACRVTGGGCLQTGEDECAALTGGLDNVVLNSARDSP